MLNKTKYVYIHVIKRTGDGYTEDVSTYTRAEYRQARADLREYRNSGDRTGTYTLVERRVLREKYERGEF